MNHLSKTNGQDKVQSISIRNLPVDVDDKMLKSIIPSAKKISSHKQTFFITFSTVKGYTDALRRLKRVDFNGVKPTVKSICRPSQSKNVIQPENVELTVQNLPQSTTLTQLKVEFPTAVSIKLKTDIWDVQKKSCLLKFQCSEDLEDVFEDCHHKLIGGQTIKAIIGVQSTLHYESCGADDTQDIHGFELVRVPSNIDDDKIRKQFPENTIVDYHSIPNNDLVTRNVFIRFVKQGFIWPLIMMLKNNVFSGFPFECRPWNVVCTKWVRRKIVSGFMLFIIETIRFNDNCNYADK
ncbi:unnamed protein product [Schistosoma intercalatum]|nr:unnamed protein product [Schistosoma intercalatum]